MTPYDVAIVGSGLGGSILARALNQRGLRVALIERYSHPRFALGESSTPLAALSLERLAVDYELRDLRNLAAYGRWQRHLPGLGCGLKRGFSFYDHRHGEPTESGRSALLVAASPDDLLGDCHWLRADVDHHLVWRARDEGVDYFERTEVRQLACDTTGVTLTLRGCEGTPSELRAGILVDATGPGGLVRQHLKVADGEPLETRSALIYGHFRDVDPVDLAPASGTPYTPHQAAVHHLIDEGWIYELRFNDGRVSAGAVLFEPPTGDATVAWSALLGRYPLLAAAYGRAEPVFPMAQRSSLQYRMASATGQNWVVLPHTFGFVDPLFSSGIAWTLRGVERLAQALTLESRRRRDEALRSYETLLQRELTQIDTLVAGAYAAMPDFELFASYCLTYFAAVSWSEIRQRLLQSREPMWQGFLGVDDDRLETLFLEARSMLPAAPAKASSRDVERYRSWTLDRIASRDLAGLDLHGPGLSVPVDLDILVERAPLLGLDAATVESRLHLLRGEI